MTTFFITIRSTEGSQTAVQVEYADGVPKVTRLSAQAAKGEGLSTEQIPPIRFDLLLRALGAQPSDFSGMDPTEPGDNLGKLKVVPDRQLEPKPPATRKKESKKVMSSTGNESPVGTTRTYRRMPADLAEVYARTGSITAMAEYYNVPRYTAQGWVGRLRQNQGATRGTG